MTGTKAIILYPMNALANDQAQRLAGLITEHKELGGITAALYTGEAGATRTTVGPRRTDQRSGRNPKRRTGHSADQLQNA